MPRCVIRTTFPSLSASRTEPPGFKSDALNSAFGQRFVLAIGANLAMGTLHFSVIFIRRPSRNTKSSLRHEGQGVQTRSV